MPLFSYQARDAQGLLTAGTLEAGSEADLARRLEGQGLLLTIARSTKSRGRNRRRKLHLSRKELVNFSYNLEAIHSAGVPIVQGLDAIAEQAGNSRIGHIAAAIADDLRGGSDLAGAMARHPQVFPPMYVNVVRSGEQAGEMANVLRRLAEYYEWLAEIRSTAVRSLTYPVILMTAVAGLVILLLTFLVPRILSMMTRSGITLPLPTRILMAVGSFLRTNHLLLIAGVLIVAAAIYLVQRTPGGRLMIDGVKLKIPIAGSVLRSLCTARFAGTVSTLYQSGISMVEALRISEGVVGNAVMERAMRDAQERLRNGRTITESLSSAHFQPLVVSMIGIGEQTGTLGESLDRVKVFCDRDVKQLIKSMLNLLEPGMVIAAGLAVAFILMSTFLPLFQMLNSVRR